MILDKNKNNKEIVIGNEDGANAVYENVNDLAVTMGYENATDLTSKLAEQMSSPNQARANQAKEIARDFTSKFALLTLYQEMLTFNDQGDYMDILSMYEDGEISAGNTKAYVNEIKTGKATYDIDSFIPTKQTTKFANQFLISIYNADKTYTVQAYEFFKEMTIQNVKWVPYFIAGTLASFISEYTKEIATVYRWFMFDKLSTLISTATPAKTVVGTALWAFDCMVDEFLPLVASMGFLSSSFNYKTGNKTLQILPVSKLTLYMSSKVRQLINTGIKTQLFNAQLLNEGTILDASNIRCLGNKIVIGDAETEITVSDTPYIDDETIYIVANDSIKILKQISKEGHQEFAKNHTIYSNSLIIGAMDILPMGGFVKYTNPNLTKIPS